MSDLESLSTKFDKLFFGTFVPEVFFGWNIDPVNDDVSNWTEFISCMLVILNVCDKSSLTPSSSDHIDDVQTNCLRFILIPFLLGE